MKIFIPGEPVAQPRPKVSTKNGFPRAYTEQDHPIHAFKQAVRLAWKSSINRCLTGPLSIEIVCWYSRPKGHSKIRRASREPKMSRPDIDNTAKGILDSLNGVAYIDDGQVYRLTVEKWYVGPEDQVGTWIEVTQ